MFIIMMLYIIIIDVTCLPHSVVPIHLSQVYPSCPPPLYQMCSLFSIEMFLGLIYT